MLIVESDDLRDEGRHAAFKDLPVAGVCGPVHHQHAELKPALPVVAYKFIICHTHGFPLTVPSVVVDEIGAPGCDGLREIRTLMIEIPTRPETGQWQCIQVQVEQRTHEVVITCHQHIPVQHPGVLEPEISTPIAVVGIKPLPAFLEITHRLHRKDRAIELDRQRTPSGAGVHVSLKQIALGNAPGCVSDRPVFEQDVMPIIEIAPGTDMSRDPQSVVFG